MLLSIIEHYDHNLFVVRCLTFRKCLKWNCYIKMALRISNVPHYALLYLLLYALNVESEFSLKTNSRAFKVVAKNV